jgi:hypothetical protein
MLNFFFSYHDDWREVAFCVAVGKNFCCILHIQNKTFAFGPPNWEVPKEKMSWRVMTMVAVCGAIMFVVLRTGSDDVMSSEEKREYQNNVVHGVARQAPWTTHTVFDAGGVYSATNVIVRQPTSVADIVAIAKWSAQLHKSVTICGKRHSMGGHTLLDNSVLIDTTRFHALLALDADAQTADVEPGMTWCELIEHTNKVGLSPQSTQSYCDFSIGGSVSVNAHGVMNDRTVGTTVVEMDVLLANLSIITCSPTNRSDLFKSVVGGYGLVGIIVRVKLQLVRNTILTGTSRVYSTSATASIVQMPHASTDTNGHASIDVTGHDALVRFLRDWTALPADTVRLARVNLVRRSLWASSSWTAHISKDVVHKLQIKMWTYKTVRANESVISNLPLEPASLKGWKVWVYKWFADYEWLQIVRSWLEDMASDVDSESDGATLIGGVDWKAPATTERNIIMYEASRPLAFLGTGSGSESSKSITAGSASVGSGLWLASSTTRRVTHILQEYFVPTDKGIEWLETFWAWHTAKDSPYNIYLILLNLTVRRVVGHDNISHHAYVKRQNRFEDGAMAFVMYYRVCTSTESDGLVRLRSAHEAILEWTRRLGGTAYMPYLRHFSTRGVANMHSSCSLETEISGNTNVATSASLSSFEVTKQHYDPLHRFSSAWFQTYFSTVSLPPNLANAITAVSPTAANIIAAVSPTAANIIAAVSPTAANIIAAVSPTAANTIAAVSPTAGLVRAADGVGADANEYCAVNDDDVPSRDEICDLIPGGYETLIDHMYDLAQHVALSRDMELPKPRNRTTFFETSTTLVANQAGFAQLDQLLTHVLLARSEVCGRPGRMATILNDLVQNCMRENSSEYIRSTNEFECSHRMYDTITSRCSIVHAPTRNGMQLRRAIRQQKLALTCNTVRLLRHIGLESINESVLALGDDGHYLASVLHHIPARSSSTILFVASPEPRSRFLLWATGTPISNYYYWYFLGHKRVHSPFPHATAPIETLVGNTTTLELVTIYIGLHHWTLEQLEIDVLPMLRRLMRPGAALIVREHDAKPACIPIIDMAHTLFNALTGVTWDEEIADFRNFQEASYYVQLLEKWGFIDQGLVEQQSGDPTCNFMRVFICSTLPIVI